MPRIASRTEAGTLTGNRPRDRENCRRFSHGEARVRSGSRAMPPRRRRPPFPLAPGDARGRAVSVPLPVVLGSHVDFAAEDRPAEADVVLYRVAAEPGITLGQPELVGDVRAEHPQLESLPDHGIDAEGQVVI